MIVKRIPAMPSPRNKSGVRARHAQQLIDYLRLPEKADPFREYLIAYLASQGSPEMAVERLLHLGARNFVAKTTDGQRYEMMATAQAAVRSPNPVDHWLLSWREDEHPTPVQVDQTVDMFLNDLGLARAQCVFAMHGDTHNRHLHLAVNRYDPTTDRVVEINNGFNLEAAHRSIARIVATFGWEPERDARYIMVAGQPVLSPAAKKKRANEEVVLEPNARAYEIRTGYMSAQRLAQQIALPLIDRAQSWPELHSSLADEGIAFEKKKGGAVLVIGQERVKASSVSRRGSLIQLQKRLGPFVARSEELLVSIRNERRDIMPNAHRAEEYRLVRNARKRETISAKLAGTRRPDRSNLPKDLESFLLERGDLHHASRWVGRSSGEFDRFAGSLRAGWAQPKEVDGYDAHVMADGVRYALPDAQTAFVDRGPTIEVVSGDDEALLAALRLASMKYERFEILGSQAFRERATKLAIKHGLADQVAGYEPKELSPKPVVSRNDWTRPDYRDDPVRIAALASLVSGLNGEQYLPLNPVFGTGANGKPTVWFSIDRDLGDALDRRHALFETAERFEDDPAIQQVYARNHERTMEIAELVLQTMWGDDRERVRRLDFDCLEQSDVGLARSLYLLRKTDEVARMLKQLEVHWRAAGKPARRGTAERPPEDTSAREGISRSPDNDPSLDGNFPPERGRKDVGR